MYKLSTTHGVVLQQKSQKLSTKIYQKSMQEQEPSLKW